MTPWLERVLVEDSDTAVAILRQRLVATSLSELAAAEGENCLPALAACDAVFETGPIAYHLGQLVRLAVRIALGSEPFEGLRFEEPHVVLKGRPDQLAPHCFDPRSGASWRDLPVGCILQPTADHKTLHFELDDGPYRANGRTR